MTQIEAARNARDETLTELQALAEKGASENRKLTDEEMKRFDALEEQDKVHVENIKRLEAVAESRRQAAAERAAKEAEAREPVGRAPILPPAPQGAHINEHYPLGDEKSMRHYSYQAVIKKTLQDRPLDGLEGEMEVEHRNEILPQAGAEGGRYIPFAALSHPTIDRQAWERHRIGNYRADLGSIDNKGKELQDESRLMSPIDILYHYMILSELGVPTLTGLGPDIRYPTFAAGSDVPAEKAQDADDTVLNPTTDDFELSPKRLPISTKLNQQIVIQAAYNVEAWLMDFLMRQIAQHIQNVFINGTGTAPQPAGLLASSTLGAAQTIGAGTNGDAVTRAKLLALMGKIDENNAWMGRLGFLMNSKTRTKLQGTLLDTGSGRFVMEGGAIPSLGQSVAVTNQVPSNGTKGSGRNLSTVIFGNWLDSVIAQWGGIWTLRDVYTGARKGLTTLHAATYYDTKVLRSVSFAKAVHLITA